MNIRLEKESDWREVETITREAFWNKYRPGCTEHFILHRFRNLPDFIPELDYVLEDEGKVIAHIMYCRAEIRTDDGHRLPIVTFGPVSVLPEYQGRGYGEELIRFTMTQAEQNGFGAVAITGDPGYYHRFGFVSGHSINVFYNDMPRTEAASFFMVKEIQKGFLHGCTGVYCDPQGYLADDAEVEAFDQGFPHKEKKRLQCQLV